MLVDVCKVPWSRSRRKVPDSPAISLQPIKAHGLVRRIILQSILQVFQTSFPFITAPSKSSFGARSRPERLCGSPAFVLYLGLRGAGGATTPETGDFPEPPPCITAFGAGAALATWVGINALDCPREVTARKLSGVRISYIAVFLYDEIVMVNFLTPEFEWDVHLRRISKPVALVTETIPEHQVDFDNMVE